MNRMESFRIFPGLAAELQARCWNGLNSSPNQKNILPKLLLHYSASLDMLELVVIPSFPQVAKLDLYRFGKLLGEIVV